MAQHELKDSNHKSEPRRYMEAAKQNPCLGCPGYCCSDNVINVCGFDVWSIATNLHVKPTDFVAFAGFNEESPYNFNLDSSGNSYCLALYMKELQDGSRRCVFTLDIPGHQVRCGIYPLRPIGCRAYPIAFFGEEVMVKPWALCPEGSWEHNQVDAAFWQKELGRHDMEFSIYAFVIAAWNAAAQQREPDELDFHPCLDFLMNVYERLDSLRREIPAESWTDIYSEWRRFTAGSLIHYF